MKNLIIICLILFSIETSAQYTNVRVSSPGSSDPEEVSIAINPLHPNYLAAGANITYFYSSTNSGSTWLQKTMSSSLGVWGDPVVIYDGLNNLYFAHLSNPISGYWIDRIVVQKSTNNGITWNDGSGIGYNYPKEQDKPWLAVDLQNNRYNNYLYTTWTEFDNYGSSNPADSSRILFSRSIDRGVSWSAPVRVSDRAGNCIDSDNTTEGAVPAVGPNGEIYVAWSGPLGIMFDRSFNGGLAWGNDIFVASQPGGWDFDVPGIYRCNGMPVTICDTSHSTTRGNVYVLWGDQRNGTDNSDVFIIKSTNNGITWGGLVKVNNDQTARHQFFPWLTIDQTTGYLYAVFYDRRNTSGAATDVYVARSRDGGKSFHNFKVSTSSFTPTSNVFFGDYTNIAAFNKKVYPIWMRLDGNLSVWTALIGDSLNNWGIHPDFISSVSDGNVNLYWQNETEFNGNGFEVQRKMNEEDNQSGWITVGIIESSSSISEPGYYSFTDQPSQPGEYVYRLKQYDQQGRYEFSDEIKVNVFTNIEFTLHQNYPNPFNPSTTLGYFLPAATHVTLKVFSSSGEEIAELVNGYKEPGEHEVEFNADNLSSGVYVYRISAGDYTALKKMILLK